MMPYGDGHISGIKKKTESRIGYIKSIFYKAKHKAGSKNSSFRNEKYLKMHLLLRSGLLVFKSALAKLATETNSWDSG